MDLNTEEHGGKQQKQTEHMALNRLQDNQTQVQHAGGVGAVRWDWWG